MDNTREKLIDRLPIDDAILILREEHKQRKDGYTTHLFYGGPCDPAEEVSLDALAMAISALEQTKWIPVTERLPEPETEVMILAQHKIYSFKGAVTTRHIMTTGMYEDGSKNTEDSNWWWETDGFEYDEELDAYIIPEGWWEYKHYNGDDGHNYAIDDKVTHWMPLPEPPKRSVIKND